MLNTYSKGRTLYTMNYNARGVRTSKIKETPSFNGINLETTNYTYDSEGRLRRETKNAFERIYLYSSDGIIGYEEDGEKFLYRKNLFGDIIAIYKGLVKVAEYTYDAWGNCTITYDPDGYGASNPIRYRGYYWDSDIKMYYLMTRYYDPKIGRFINADSFEYLNPKTINGLNLYSYCNNNPVINIDPMGTFSYTCWDEDGGDDLNAETFKSFGGGGMHGTNQYCSSDNTITIIIDEKNSSIDNFSEFDLSDIDWSALGEKAIFYAEQGVYYTKVIVLAITGLPAFIIFVPLMAWADKNGITLSAGDVAGATQTVVGAAGNYTDSRYSGRISSGIGDKIMYTMFGDDATGFYDFLE